MYQKTISYNNNSINNNANVIDLTHSKTNLTQSPSHSDPPTYPQQYVPLNLEPQQNIKNLKNINPIIQYHNSCKHIKNISNTMESNNSIRDNYNFHENTYTNSEYSNKYIYNKINKHYMNDSFICGDSYNDIPSISKRDSLNIQNNIQNNIRNKNHYQSHSMHTTTTTHSHHRNHRKQGHYHRPFSANHRNQYSHHEKKKTITRIYPSKLKLSQNNAYSTPVYHNESEYLVNHNNYLHQHWNENNQNQNQNTWYIDPNEHERSHTDTTIVRNYMKDYNNNTNNNEGRKSHSFSHLGMSMDDMMTPLSLSPAPHRNGHRKQKRSQSVVDFFDPIQPSNLSDLHIQKHNKNENENENQNQNEKDNKKYKIVLRDENSNKYYNNSNNNNQLIKPRFSSSTTTNSFTPTISQTPSYLREENLWKKSIKISQTGSSEITSEDDDRFHFAAMGKEG